MDYSSIQACISCYFKNYYFRLFLKLNFNLLRLKRELEKFTSILETETETVTVTNNHNRNVCCMSFRVQM